MDYLHPTSCRWDRQDSTKCRQDSSPTHERTPTTPLYQLGACLGWQAVGYCYDVFVMRKYSAAQCHDGLSRTRRSTSRTEVVCSRLQGEKVGPPSTLWCQAVGQYYGEQICVMLWERQRKREKKNGLCSAKRDRSEEAKVMRNRVRWVVSGPGLLLRPIFGLMVLMQPQSVEVHGS